jgi:hypothetical protein
MCVRSLNRKRIRGREIVPYDSVTEQLDHGDPPHHLNLSLDIWTFGPQIFHGFLQCDTADIN